MNENKSKDSSLPTKHKATLSFTVIKLHSTNAYNSIAPSGGEN